MATLARRLLLLCLMFSGAAALSLPSARSGRRALLKTTGVACTTIFGLGLSQPATASSSVFVGKFTDPINHPGGVREISLLDVKMGPFQLAKVKGGGGRGEPASYELPAMVGIGPDGQEIITIDFTPKGGPKDFVGVFEQQAD
jgi:hypothetical protein